MKWYLTIIIVLTIIVLALFFVSPQPENCSCNGVSFGMCLGTLSCETQESNCIPLTCDTKYDLLGDIDLARGESQIYTILIVDASKSMEGENLDATKRASEAFVQEISNQEYLAIMEFNEEATILTDFTNDKVELYSSIELINPVGRTQFFEPFSLANDMFASVPENARKYILFLSDGAPEDEESLFLEQIELLEEKKVNIYALAFADKSNEELMKEIASKDENLFLVSTAQDIEEKFVEAFTTILEEGDLGLESISEQTTFRSQEMIELELYSLHNGGNLLLDETYCSLETTSYIEAQQRGTFTRILGQVTGGIIGFPLSTLNSGSYELIAHTKVFLDECTLSATEQLGSIDIVQEEDCNISCEDIGLAMTGGRNFSYVSERPRTTWNILVDRSSSMDQGEHLRKAKEDIELLLTLMPATDIVTVGSFDNRANILASFAHPQEIPDLDIIVPSASTSLIVALDTAERYSRQATTSQVHTLIFSDGEYGIQDIKRLNRSLQSLQGCISTISYGTHLLTENESAFNLLQDERSCGSDIITRPSREELLDLLESNQSTSPELIFQLQKKSTGNQSEYVVRTLSTFTGKTPLAKNDNCQLSPLTTITFSDGRELVANQFSTAINESFSLQAGFENGQCSFEITQDIEFVNEEQRDSILTIVAVVALVLAINMLVFIYVLSRKLKKLTRIR